MIAFGAISTASVKDKKTPETDASASPADNASPSDNSEPIVYRGKVAAVDATARMFTVGNRAIRVTAQTRITKPGAAATMADIVASEVSSPQLANRKQGSPIPATSGAERHAKIIDEHRVFAPTRFFIPLPEER